MNRLTLVRTALVALALVALAACGGSPSDGAVVRSADLGDDWPFTADEATVRCEDGPALIATINGVDYALNGVAISQGYEELTLASAVWLDNPDTGAKKNLRPVTTRAEGLC